MKMKKADSIRSVLIILLSIILILSGPTVMASSDEIPPVPNKFYGNISINGEWASVGTVIEAYIDNELHSEDYGVQDGQYYIFVTGINSDEGKTITFKVNEETSKELDIWHASTIPIEARKIDHIIGEIPSSPHPVGGISNGFVSPSATSEMPVSEEDNTITENSTATSEVKEDSTFEEPTDNESTPAFEIIFASVGFIMAVFLLLRKR